jgi:AraC-like DNA-binding protein
VQEFVQALGYTEIANLRRAFKRWEGVPPSAFHESARAPRDVV